MIMRIPVVAEELMPKGAGESVKLISVLLVLDSFVAEFVAVLAAGLAKVELAVHF